MIKYTFIFLAIGFVSHVVLAQEFPSQDTTQYNTFFIHLSPESCKEELSYTSEYSEKTDEKKGVRIITANGIPNHKTGEFPNQGNPNQIRPQRQRYELPLKPEFNEVKTSAMGKRIGVLFSGVEVDPFTGEFFEGSHGRNPNWNITTLTNAVNLGLDCNNAHVQPNGKYHYHGTPSAMLNEMGADGTEMIKLGYAADGVSDIL